MINKNVKKSITIGLTAVILILMGYVLRIDRFGMSKISWVDCVQINGIKYYSKHERTPVEYSSISNKIGQVKFNVSRNVSNPNYKFRNGDATILDAGTEIYSLDSANNAIAVKVKEDYFVYKSDLYK